MRNQRYHRPLSGTARRATVLIAFMLAGAIVAACKEPPPVVSAPTTVPTTMPMANPKAATAPVTRPVIAVTQPVAPRTFVELVKRIYPDCPATQPLDTPVDRKDAARIILRDPIHLDRFQHLWVTRSDADPTNAVLARAGSESEHFLREKPVYVHWRYEPGVGKKPGRSMAVLVCPPAGEADIEFVEEGRRTKIKTPRPAYQWSNAYSWNDNIVVGHSTGASVFTRTPEGWTEIPSPDLIDGAIPHAATQVPMDLEGLLAYIPAERGSSGSKKVARFVDGTWSPLKDTARWPGNFLHLIPLADGSVLQIIVGDEGKSSLAITDFSTTKVDRRHVLELLEQLDHPDHAKRDAAFRELSTYGSGLWPILEAEMDNQPPSVREKMAELLKNKTDPTLGEMSLVDSELKLASRAPDGSVLLYTKGGVSVTNVDGDQTLAAPAWISIRPGQPIQLMLGQVWADLTPNQKRFYSVGNEWIVSDDVLGPREMIGTFEWAAILRKSDVKYNDFIGIDRHGRWFFREPMPASGTRPTETLVLDPTLPPVSPRLPVWEFAAIGGSAGCDDRGWPAYKDKGENVWLIGEGGFQLLDKKKGHYISDPAVLAKIPQPPAATATTQTSTRPTTIESTPPLLILADGTRYFGGQTELRRIGKEGEINWPLPPQAQGSVKPWMIAEPDGRLFLFNEPGRLLRIRPTPGAAEPFKLDATFAHKIPNVEPARLWLDPAGRIIFAHDGNQLAICFPSGVVPAAIADKIPALQKDDDDE